MFLLRNDEQTNFLRLLKERVRDCVDLSARTRNRSADSSSENCMIFEPKDKSEGQIHVVKLF